MPYSPRLIMLFAVVMVAACSDSDTQNNMDTNDSGTADTATSTHEDTSADTFDAFEPDLPECASPPGLLIGDGCTSPHIVLLPRVKLQDRWQGGGEDGECTFNTPKTEVTCPVGEGLGQVSADIENGTSSFRVRFEASSDVVVQGLELKGEATLESATSWMSNGFQSWSGSGMVAIQGPIDNDALTQALHAVGDEEVIRQGNEISWFYTFAGSPSSDEVLFAGALHAERWKPWARVEQSGDAPLQVRFVSGGTGEAVAIAAGESTTGEPWMIKVGTNIEMLAKNYGQALPRYRQPSELSAPMGWNSWYDLWNTVDEPAVRNNAERVREILNARRPEGTEALWVVVDDGWQKTWGDWTPNEKFPAGMDGLAADLVNDGHQAGIWLAPLLVEASSALAQEHPDWFVEDTLYTHLKIGEMRILDPTHPEAAAHLQQVIAQVVSWGYTLLKIDFLFAGTFEGKRHAPVTGMEAYQQALTLIREAAGDNTLLIGVGAPPIATFPFVDGWRLGPDIALENFGVSWAFIPNQARNIAARWFLCDAVLCDADPPLLRDLQRNEVEAGVWVAAMAGGALFLSDDLRALEPERADWGLDPIPVAQGVSGRVMVPEDIFPTDPPGVLVTAINDLFSGESSHVLPAVWRLPNGEGKVVMNIKNDARTIDGTTVPARSVQLKP